MKIEVDIRVPLWLKSALASMNKGATRDAVLALTTGHTMKEHTALAHKLAQEEVKTTAANLDNALAEKIAAAIKHGQARGAHEDAKINLAMIEAALKEHGLNKTTAKKLAVRVQKSLNTNQQ